MEYRGRGRWDATSITLASTEISFQNLTENNNTNENITVKAHLNSSVILTPEPNLLFLFLCEVSGEADE